MFLVAGILLALALPAEVPVTGRVVDARSSSPLAGAVVECAGQRSAADTEGRFTLMAPPGKQTLKASAPGHLSDTLTVEIRPDGAKGLEIRLPEIMRRSEQVEVEARTEAEKGPAALPVRPASVLSVAGAADNIFRVLHTLPGVSPTDEFGSRLSVRGGGPDQNLTVMDGVEIHNPYRLFGLTSAFNPETVESFELVTGAFSARYGDRLSSLLIVDNRQGSRERKVGGTSSLSITDANVIVEGRLPRGSWLLTGRRTYYDLVAERIVDEDLPSFGDVQVKAAWDLGGSRRLQILGLRSREGTDASFEGDIAGESGVFRANVGNDVLAADFRSSFARRGSTRTLAAVYRNSEFLDADVRFQDTGHRANTPEPDIIRFTTVVFDRTLTIRDFSLRQEVGFQASDRHLLEAGVELHRLRTGVRFAISGARNPDQANGSSVQGGAGLPDRLDSARASLRSGAFLQDRFTQGALIVEPGLRLDWSGVNGRSTLSPRLAATLGLGSRTRLRMSLGRHRQSPGYEKLLQADYFLDLTQVGRLDLASERADHVVLGVERDLPGGFTARLEGYHKGFDGLIMGRLETEAEVRDRVSEYDFPPHLQSSVPREPLITSDPTNDAKGRSYGFDIYVSRRAAAERRLSGWASYTFGIAERDAYGRTYSFEYDRRHALSVVASVRAKSWLDLAVTARAASGFPRTPVVGLRVNAAPDLADRDGDGNRSELVPDTDSAGRLVYTYHLGGVSNLNTARLPAFARVDLRATAHRKSGRWQFYLDILNVLNRKNASAVDIKLEYDPASDRPRIVETPTGNIPFLPTFGVRFRF